MGASYTAYAVIGVEIPAAKLYREARVRLCQHEAPAGATFCPTCGKPAWGTEKEPIAAYKPDGERPHFTPKLAGWDVAVSSNGERAYIGLVCRGVPSRESYREPRDQGDFRHLTGGDVNDLRQKLQADLEPLGLWDGVKFGLWAVLYCSC